MENTNQFSPCDYVNKFNDNQPKPLTSDLFLSFINGSDTKMHTEIVRQHKPNAETYKKLLPAVTWQARFGGKLRTAANAQRTPFYALDVDIHHEYEFKYRLQKDGIDEAYKWAEQEARERAERWARMQREANSDVTATDPGIVGIHVSPSGTGVHVIALCKPQFTTIADQQKWLADLLGTEYDAVCKDNSRIWFLTPREDWTYLDMENLFEE